MDKVFQVYAASEDSNEDRYAVLSLPATPYELLEVLERNRVKYASDLYVQIEEYYRFPQLAGILSGISGDDLDLLELNALAQKLSELDELQSISFEGLVNIEDKKQDFLDIPRLIDLAYSADCCYVVVDVEDDAALGKFYAENGLVPKVENLPDEVFELLDFEKIGREIRQDEGGVFTSCGYVVQHTELLEAYKDMDLTPGTPDYAVLLELTKNDKSVLLKLPAEPKELNAAFGAIGAQNWQEAGICCLDCRAPMLDELISGCDSSIEKLNRFAQMLADMDGRDLSTYKALLEATKCDSFNCAELLSDTLDQYVCSPQIDSPVEMARAELDTVVSKQDAEMLIPHLNMYAYGRALLDRFGGVLTSYGLIERQDGQPLRAFTEQQSQRGGLEMSM